MTLNKTPGAEEAIRRRMGAAIRKSVSGQEIRFASDPRGGRRNLREAETPVKGISEGLSATFFHSPSEGPATSPFLDRFLR